MAVYLFDEKRWYEYNPDDYASLIKGAVTDLIVLVYGSVHGGAIGWKSRFIDSMDGVTESLFKGLRHSLDKK